MIRWVCAAGCLNRENESGDAHLPLTIATQSQHTHILLVTRTLLAKWYGMNVE